MCMRKHVDWSDVSDVIIRIGENIVEISCERCWITADIDNLSGSKFENIR